MAFALHSIHCPADDDGISSVKTEEGMMFRGSHGGLVVLCGVRYVCGCKLNIIGSNNGLSPRRLEYR